MLTQKINDKLVNSIVSQISDFIIKNRSWFTYLLVVSILSYAFALFNFSFSIDQEYQVMATKPATYLIELDRWGAYFLNAILFPNPVMPFVTLFVTLIFAALGFSIVTRILSTERTIADYISSPIFIAFPTLFYIYSFNTINFAFGAGILASAASIYFFIKNTKYTQLFSILSAACALSMYQSMATTLFTIFLLYLLNSIIRGKLPSVKVCTRLILRFILMMFLAFIVYFVISYVCYFSFNIQPSTYLSNFFKVSTDFKYWIHTINHIISQATKYYLGSKSIYIYHLTSLMLLFIYIFSTTLFLIFSSRQTSKLKIIGFFGVLSLIFTPFVFNILNGGFMPARTVTSSLPLVVGGLTFISWNNKSTLLRLLCTLLIISCFYNFVVINNKFAFSNYLSWKADEALTVRLLTNLDNVRPKNLLTDANKQIPLVVAGYYQRQPSAYMISKDTIGASFYSWDNGNVNRIISLMNTLGIFEYVAATPQQTQSIMPQINKLPVWPNNGSITFINNIAVLHFGDHNH